MKLKDKNETGTLGYFGTCIEFTYLAFVVDGFAVECFDAEASKVGKIMLKVYANTFNSYVLDALKSEFPMYFSTWGKLHRYLSQFPNWQINEAYYSRKE